VAKGSIRRFDVQAKWAAWLALASIVPCVMMAGLIGRNWQPDINQIVFGNPVFQFIFFACAGTAMLLSTFGVALGYNSAGQRRNNLQRRSWLGFFLGAGTLAVAFILLAAFWLLKFKATTGA